MSKMIKVNSIQIGLLLLGFLFFQSCPNGKASDKIQSIDDKFIVTTEGKKLKIPIITDESLTTFILVRHAEKQMEGENPHLTDAGMERADNLAQILNNVPLSHIYSTDFARTKETAYPAANKQKLSLDLYNKEQQNELLDLMKKDKAYTNVLLIGHSDTVPAMMNHLTNSKKYKDIEHESYDNIFIVRTVKGSKPEVYKMKF